MYACQQSLIAHLQTQFTAPTVNTIKEYAGELRDAIKLTEQLPAIYSVYIDGNPAALDRQHQFDLLIITKSTTLQKVEAKNSAISLAEQVALWLRDKTNRADTFANTVGSGVFVVDLETLRARTLLAGDEFSIIVLSLFIKDNSE